MGRRWQAERYGHPYERPQRASALPLAAVEGLLVTYLGHALRGAARCRRRTWGDVHAFNAGVDWAPWVATAMQTTSAWGQ